jgi:hypothetical protein
MRNVKSWQVWDWKSIGIFCFVLICILLIYTVTVSPSLRHSINGKLLTATTQGTFLDEKDVTEFYQSSKTGNHLIVTKLTVEYSYTVNGEIYYATDNLDNTANNKLYISKLMEFPNILEVKYNPSIPSKSQIIINP